MKCTSVSEVSHGLNELLCNEGGGVHSDRLEVVKFDPEVGSVKLNDYYTDIGHKRWDVAGHTRDRQAFYNDGFTPIVGLSLQGDDPPTPPYFLFRPTDVVLQGRVYRRLGVSELLPELQASTELLVTNDQRLVEDPLRHPEFTALIGVLLGETIHTN